MDDFDAYLSEGSRYGDIAADVMPAPFVQTATVAAPQQVTVVRSPAPVATTPTYDKPADGSPPPSASSYTPPQQPQQYPQDSAPPPQQPPPPANNAMVYGGNTAPLPAAPASGGGMLLLAGAALAAWWFFFLREDEKKPAAKPTLSSTGYRTPKLKKLREKRAS